jgi:hypothetical protein
MSLAPLSHTLLATIATLQTVIVGRVEISPGICLTQFLEQGEIVETIQPCDDPCHL